MVVVPVIVAAPGDLVVDGEPVAPGRILAHGGGAAQDVQAAIVRPLDHRLGVQADVGLVPVGVPPGAMLLNLLLHALARQGLDGRQRRRPGIGRVHRQRDTGALDLRDHQQAAARLQRKHLRRLHLQIVGVVVDRVVDLRLALGVEEPRDHRRPHAKGATAEVVVVGRDVRLAHGPGQRRVLLIDAGRNLERLGPVRKLVGTGLDPQGNRLLAPVLDGVDQQIIRLVRHDRAHAEDPFRLGQHRLALGPGQVHRLLERGPRHVRQDQVQIARRDVAALPPFLVAAFVPPEIGLAEMKRQPLGHAGKRHHEIPVAQRREVVHRFERRDGIHRVRLRIGDHATSQNRPDLVRLRTRDPPHQQ